MFGLLLGIGISEDHAQVYSPGLLCRFVPFYIFACSSCQTK